MSIWQEVKFIGGLVGRATTTVLFAILILVLEVIITFLVGMLLAQILLSL